MKKFLKIVFIILLCLTFTAAVLYFWMNARTSQVFGNLTAKVNTTEKIVALTFDDGPTANTPEILKYLSEQNVKATFFVVGESLEKNPELGKAIFEQGSELGNHSYTHQRMVFKSPSFISSELGKTNEEIRKTGFAGVINFRPPYGKKLLFLPWYANKLGMKTIMWNIEVDSNKSSDQIAKYVLDNVSPGSIIILHPMYNRSDLEAIPKVIAGLKEQGYNLLTVNELLEHQQK
ncbi:MAG: polysaccharide deacetylase family protein [Candidatus Doudnabacteria bacterium]|nr:polysaccharide deacetylase family protein [Candidatus Doudnabacteria bacterium]